MTMKIRRKPYIPDPSRFDRLDDQSLHLLVEQSLAQAQAMYDKARHEYGEEKLAYMQYVDTALSDAQAGTRALIRRRVVLMQST